MLKLGPKRLTILTVPPSEPDGPGSPSFPFFPCMKKKNENRECRLHP